MKNPASIRFCPLCGGEGKIAHAGLRDFQYNASGTWNLIKCLSGECGIFWLDPMPTKKELNTAYADYHTHNENP